MDADTRLALAAQAGDDAALARLVRGTQHEVWRLCAHLTDVGSADDLTQEVYLRALRSLPGFEARSSLRTWLLSIARRTCADEIRRRVRHRERHLQLAGDGGGDGGGDVERYGAADRSDTGEAVALDALVAGLGEDRRAVFVLTQLLGLSYAEAAEVCDCPVGTVRSRVARAREDLLSAVGPAPSEGTRRQAPGEVASRGRRAR